MQDRLVAGETLNYSAALADYPASSGWALTLYLNPRAGGTVRSVVSTADGDAHLLQATAATTAAWAAGSYAWELWAALGAEAYRLEAGQLEVLPSLVAAAAGLDTRTAAEIMLDGLKAKYREHMTSGNAVVGEYTVNGRSVKYKDVAQLIKAIHQAEREVQAERAAARMAAGLSPRTRWAVRM